MLGLAEKRKVIRIDSGSPEAMQDEKDLILNDIRFLVTSICSSDQRKLNRAMALIDMAASNSPEWFWMRRHKLLGYWCEMFIKGYEYRPSKLNRDDFLDADGVFIPGLGGETMTYHGRGR